MIPAHAPFSLIVLVDVVVAVIGVEFIVLSWRSGWRAPAMLTLVFALTPGACLALAVRAALHGENWIWVVAFLTASLPFHLADLWRRKL